MLHEKPSCKEMSIEMEVQLCYKGHCVELTRCFTEFLKKFTSASNTHSFPENVDDRIENVKYTKR